MVEYEHIIKCSTCKDPVAKITLLRDDVDLKVMKFHCNKCNFPCDDVTWIDSQKRMQADRDKSFETMKKLNGAR